MSAPVTEYILLNAPCFQLSHKTMPCIPALCAIDRPLCHVSLSLEPPFTKQDNATICVSLLAELKIKVVIQTLFSCM